MLTAAADKATDSRPFIRLATPDAQYLDGEAVELLVHPPSAAHFDFRIIAIGRGEAVHQGVEIDPFIGRVPGALSGFCGGDGIVGR